MEQITESVTKPWGSYKPDWRQKMISFVVKTGLSHGAVKGLLQRLWYLNGTQYPADIIYQGVKFRLHPWDNVKDGKLAFGSAVQDAMELNFLKKRLMKESVFIDIGANIGYYSCILASNGAGRIIAVEPHPFTRKRLAFNVHINNFDAIIQIAPYALGEANKEILLTEMVGNLGGSNIRSQRDNAKKQFKVEMISLQELCRQYEITSIDALKIDVEGVEDLVLIPFFKSAPPSSWPQCIVIEHAHQKDWKSDLLGYLEEKGYVVQKKNSSNSIFTIPAPGNKIPRDKLEKERCR